MTTCNNVKFMSAYRAQPPRAQKFGSSQPAVAAVQSEAAPATGAPKVSSVALKDALMGQIRFGNGLFDSTAHVPFSQAGGTPRANHVDARSFQQYQNAVAEAPVSMLPSIIHATEQGMITLDPISWMYNNNIIYLNGGINQASSLSFIAQLDALTTKIMLRKAAEAQSGKKGEDKDPADDVTPKDEIRIYINSPGGSVIDLYGMLDAMKRTQSMGIDISTYCRGLAASAASVVLALGTPGKRYVTPNSLVMIHQPLGGASGQATDIGINNDLIQKMKKKLTKMLAESTNGKKSYDELLQVMERDHWLEAEEALSYGLVDQIADM